MLLSDPQAGGGTGAHPRFRGQAHHTGPNTLRGSRLPMAQDSWLAGVSGHRGDPAELVGQEVLGTSPGVCRSAPPACPRVGTSLLMPGPTCRGQPGHWARDARLPSPLARASRHVLASAAPSSQTVLQPMQEVLGPGDPVRWNVSTQGLHPPPGRDALIHASDVTCTLRP